LFEKDSYKGKHPESRSDDDYDDDNDDVDDGDNRYKVELYKILNFNVPKITEFCTQSSNIQRFRSSLEGRLKF
jgi:hypothetical protein